MRCFDTARLVFLFDWFNDDVGQCLLLLARLHFGLSESPSPSVPLTLATPLQSWGGVSPTVDT